MNTSNNFNAELWRAYSNTENLWDQNLINGEYVIAYAFNSSLDQKLIDMLPKVRFRFRSISAIEILNQDFNFKAMEKIEEVTCIKFEERSQNNHKERF